MSTNLVFLFTTFCLIFNSVRCAEFVPVYMWDTFSSTTDHVPALHKYSQDSFKEVISEHLKNNNNYIVVFAEQTLSPEDFAQKDQTGNTAFTNLSKLKETSTVTYLPSVQNPIKALKHLNENVAEVSIESLSNDLPKERILIVDLNDAQDGEHRIEMLKRHDSKIVSIYNKVVKKNKNVVALYTAHHTSWVDAEKLSRSARSLLEVTATEDKNRVFNENASVYIRSVVYNTEPQELTFNTPELDNNGITLIGSNEKIDVTFNLRKLITDYWILQNVELTDKSNSKNATFNNTQNVYAPISFSYHCSKQSYVSKSDNTEMNLILDGFQIQMLPKSDSKFGDAYDCVGFTSVPIWSGLFVTFILLLILTFGLTMIMDIKTMDRFDDAKGQTITINATE